MYDFKELKLQILRVFDNQANFAEAMDMSTAALSQRLNNNVDWSTKEMFTACKLLNIPLEKAHEYFFVPKV